MRFSYQFPLWRTRMAEAVTAVMMAFWRGRGRTSFGGGSLVLDGDVGVEGEADGVVGAADTRG